MNKIRKIIGVSIFILLLCFTLGAVMNFLERKESNIKNGSFFKQEKDFDILFFGSSHIINGVFPMDLWQDFGYVSFNLGGYGARIPTSYWTMMNAFDYTSPKLIVIDMAKVECVEMITPDFEHVHIAFDCFPLSKTKWEAIQDLTEDKKQRMELMFEFSIYHGRWAALEEEDFNWDYSPEMGAKTMINVSPAALPTLYDKTSRRETDDFWGEGYLRKMIEECQKRNIEVLLIQLPYPNIVEVEAISANLAYDLQNEYGVNYLNFFDYPELINYETDWYDGTSHLNASGARKVTKFLGEYIKDNYEIENQKDNVNYANWDENYNNYLFYKIELLNQEMVLNNYLMLLSDDDFTGEIIIRENSIVSEDKLVQDLLNNLGEKYLISYKEDVPDIIKIAVKDKDGKTTIDEAQFNLDEKGSLLRENEKY